MNSANPNAQRSWTSTDEPTVSKWFPITVLLILLGIGIYIFTISVWWTEGPRTFAVAISIPEYEESWLAQPAFPEWDLNSATSSFAEKGLTPWDPIKTIEASTSNDILNALTEIGSEKDGRKIGKVDTVLVYLRGHAINHRGTVYLAAKEFDRQELQTAGDEARELPHAVSLQVILERLQQLKAGNVVLLADICDISTAPQLGVIANDIPKLIEKSLAELDPKQRIWVITSSAALQPSHASALRQRTLLQSACEYAAHPRHAANSDSFLSLATFYEAILRYSDAVTEGTQTPLLFRSGVAGAIIDDNKSWKDASSVSIAARKPLEIPAAIPDPLKSKEEAAEGNSKTVAKEQPTEAVATEKGAVIEQDPWLRYWQICDELRSRKMNPAGWSPVDFAMQSWRESMVKAAQLERLHRIGDSDSSDIRNLVDALEALGGAIKSDNPVGRSDGLNRAWAALKQELSPESGKRPWSMPDDLPADQQTRWLQIRQNYRIYFDAMGQLSGWMDTALNEDATQRGELLQGVRRLVDLLQEVEVDLPKANDSVLDHPLTPSKVTAIQAALDELSAIRSRQAKNTLASMDKRITWRTERALQQLLQDTNLAFAERKLVFSAYSTIKTEQVEEPGTGNNEVEKSKTLASLINLSATEGALQHYANWCGVLAQAVNMAGETRVSRTQESSAESLNKWGQNLLATTYPSATDDTTLKWKRACLNDWNLFSAVEGEYYQPGLLRVVSNDASLVAYVPPSVQLPNQLECTVMRRNGTRLQNCWVQWSAQPPAGFNKGVRELLRVSLPAAQGELEPDKSFQAGLLGGRLNLILATSIDQVELPQGISLRVGIGSDEDAKSMQWHDVIVTPPNPDRIDLYAKSTNPAAGNNGLIFTNDTSREPILKSLSVPAIDGAAKSRYEFYLANRSDDNKTITAQIYYVESARLVGNGSIEASAIARTKRDLSKLRPAFQTLGPITLPKAEQSAVGNATRANGQRLVLVANEQADPVAANAGAVGAARGSSGEFGLLCVVNEVAINEDKSLRNLDKTSLYWIECMPANPYGELVKVTPIDTLGSFEFQIEVSKAEWTRWGLEALKIEAMLTDADGTEIPSAGGSVELTAENLEGRLTIRPRVAIPNNSKAVAHLDIGGYTRAYAFDSRLKGENNETRVATQAFSWLETQGITCTGREGKQVLAQQMGDAIVIPNRDGADDKALGNEVNVTNLSVPFRIDFPKSGLRAFADLSLDEGREKQTFYFDRRFTPAFEVEGGNLIFSATVDDMLGLLPIPRSGLDGKVELEASVVDSSNERTARSVNLIFDRKAPLKSRVELSSQKLYLEDSLDISIIANDEDSSVKQAYFAIDVDGLKSKQYDAEDLVHIKANPFNGRWTARMEAAKIEELLPGSYTIVCRTIDFAGNVQDENSPSTFTWTGAKRPVSAPPVKPTTPPPPANEPKEHTVIVQVLVGGAAPPIPKKVNVSGIAGATEVNSGGTMIYTKVPDGSYEINATYEDAFGVKYAGKGKLVLSASSAKQIRIEVVKQAK